MKITDKHRFWNLIGAAILVFGLVGAVALYATAPEDEEILGNKIVGDKMYPVVPNKLYIRNLELYGGKTLVLVDNVERWLNERWHGKSLGVTIAWISIITAGLIFFFNNYVSFDEESESDAVNVDRGE